MLTFTRRVMLGVTAATLALSTLPAMAQDYPSKPVTIVVSYAAGGGTDAIARVFAARLEKAIGGRVIVENRPGAAANMGTDVVAKADPDGYTLLIGNQGPMVVNPHIFKLRNDPAETLDPIAMIADAQLVVVAGPSLQVNSMQELLEKAKQDQLVYGSAGNASASHVATLLLGQMAGIKLKHVPYKGAGPAINDLLGGHVDFMVTTVPSVIGLVQDGTLKALAVTGKERFAALPDVPTSRNRGCRNTAPRPGTACWVPRACPRTCAPSWPRVPRKRCATRLSSKACRRTAACRRIWSVRTSPTSWLPNAPAGARSSRPPTSRWNKP
nr:tripartite tricarboxylate transporter substrate binding protein [Paracoccus mutanolyticus]